MSHPGTDSSWDKLSHKESVPNRDKSFPNKKRRPISGRRLSLLVIIAQPEEKASDVAIDLRNEYKHETYTCRTIVVTRQQETYCKSNACEHSADNCRSHHFNTDRPASRFCITSINKDGQNAQSPGKHGCDKQIHEFLRDNALRLDIYQVHEKLIGNTHDYTNNQDNDCDGRENASVCTISFSHVNTSHESLYRLSPRMFRC